MNSIHDPQTSSVSQNSTLSLVQPHEFRTLQLVALVSVSAWGFSQAHIFLMPLCFSALIAFLMTPCLRFMKAHGLSENSSLFLTACLFILPFITLAYGIISQAETMSQQIPSIVEFIRRELTEILTRPWALRLNLSEKIGFPSLALRLNHEIKTGLGMSIALDWLKEIFLSSGEFILILMFSLMMLASRERLKRSIEQMLRLKSPSVISDEPGLFLESIAELIQRFLVVRLGIALFVGGIDWLILMGFGFPFALLLGVASGLMTLIPVFGFAFSIIPTILLSAACGFSVLKTVSLFASLFLVSTVEGNILTPKLLGRHLNLNILVTFLGLFAGECLWGAGGVFLSIPILGIFRIILTTAPEGSPWSRLMAEKEDRRTYEPIPPLSPLPEDLEQIARGISFSIGAAPIGALQENKRD